MAEIQWLVGLQEPATFYVCYERIAPAQNKFVATLFNTSSTRKVVIQRVWVVNWQAAAVTGVLLEFELKRITARTAGTSVTPAAADSKDSLSAGITADHASTAVTEGNLVRRVFSANEETKIGALTLENLLSLASHGLIYEKRLGVKGETLRQNQGITVKQITSSTVGTVSVIIEFTDEPA